jgi:lipopolysaccharide heptosyltransferase II
MKISANVIAFNEEKNIERCLKSLDFADEIILVIDKKTTDRTGKIASRYTKKIYYREFDGFSDIKNFCIEKSSGDWIFSIDADEEVSAELKKSIVEKAGTGTDDGYYTGRATFFLGRLIKHCGWGNDRQLRLFKKAKGTFNGRIVHESVAVKGPVGVLNGILYHYSYPDSFTYFSKLNQYTTMQSRERMRQFPVFRMVTAPFLKFLRMYILKAGFLDGFQGFILSVYSGFSEFAKFSKMWEEKAVLRREDGGLLIRMPNWIGDAVMATLVLKPARAIYKKVYVAADRSVAAVFEGNQDIDGLIIFDKKDRRDRARALKEIKKLKADQAVTLTPSVSSGIMLARAGIRLRAGFSEEGIFLNRVYNRDMKHKDVHIIDEYAKIFGMLEPPVMLAGSQQEIFTDSVMEAKVKKRFGISGRNMNVVMAPFVMYGPAKMWPIEKWMELAVKILERHRHARIFVIGTPADAAFDFNTVNERLIDLRGKTGLKEAFILIKNASLFIGNDSGLMHAADAFKVPLIAVFGSTSFNWTGPVSKNSRVIFNRVACSPCFEKTCRYGHYNCIKGIAEETVLEEAEHMLKG